MIGLRACLAATCLAALAPVSGALAQQEPAREGPAETEEREAESPGPPEIGGLAGIDFDQDGVDGVGAWLYISAFPSKRTSVGGEAAFGLVFLRYGVHAAAYLREGRSEGPYVLASVSTVAPLYETTVYTGLAGGIGHVAHLGRGLVFRTEARVERRIRRESGTGGRNRTHLTILAGLGKRIGS